MSATVYMLLNVDAAFSPLFAIQFAAFLMTMVRKSIIRPNTWHLLYSWALMINIFVLYTLSLSQVANIFIGTFIFRTLRMKYRVNKYIAWSFIFLIISLFDLSSIDTYTYNKYIINGLIVWFLGKTTYATRALYYN